MKPFESLKLMEKGSVGLSDDGFKNPFKASLTVSLTLTSLVIISFIVIRFYVRSVIAEPSKVYLSSARE